MRLSSITLDGFRAFGSRQDFDLGADATIVVGANGQGKTSMFDGILWALTGRIQRFSSERSVLSMWSQSGQAHVELGLASPEGRVDVIRRFDGEETMLAVKSDGRILRGAEAETELLRLLWAEGLAAAEPQKALCSALERGTYLQQDLVTQFIAADSPQERFAAISELIGSGRIRELQEALERARRAWSSATTTQTREREDAAQRVSTLRDRLAQLGEPTAHSEDLEQDWAHWWEVYRDLIDSSRPTPELGSDATSTLDIAIRELHGRTAVWEQRWQEIERAAELVAAMPARPTDDLEDLERRVHVAEADLETAQATLVTAREEAASLRRQHSELQEQQKSLTAFASLALTHLGDHCPVCGQDYDRAHTAAHLQEIVAQTGESPQPPAPSVSGQAAAVEAAERRLAHARATAEAAAHRLSTWQARGTKARAALAALGVEESSDIEASLRNLGDEEKARTARAGDLRADGESLALWLTRIGEQARRQEVQAELREQEPALSRADKELAARQRTSDVATAIIEGLREASASVVAARLDEMRPLIQRFFATADPHPAFRNARLSSSFKRGAGRVTPSLSDPTTAKTTNLPYEYLSSSQVNVLAVSVFLAMNLSMPSLPVRAAILDDPLQSLDDLNLLGLVDLLRRLREHRQLLVSTHDERFAQLLRRKLRPVSAGQRTRVIVFESWQREGPVVRQFDVDREQVPMRLVS